MSAKEQKNPNGPPPYVATPYAPTFTITQDDLFPTPLAVKRQKLEIQPRGSIAESQTPLAACEQENALLKQQIDVYKTALIELLSAPLPSAQPPQQAGAENVGVAVAAVPAEVVQLMRWLNVTSQ